MARIRADYVFGITDTALTSSDTTLSSPGLGRLPVVAAPDVAAITLHNSTAGTYEIVYVTAHAAAATTATIARGKEGSAAADWAEGSSWLHGLTVADVDELAAASGGGGGGAASGIDNAADWGTDLGYDVEFETNGTSLPAGWSWVNQGTSTWEIKYGAGIITPQAGTGGDTGQRMIVRSLPTETTWAATLKTSGTPPDQGYGHIGMVLRDSVSGKYAIIGVRSTDTVALTTWSATESYGGTLIEKPFRYGDLAYFRVRKNASSWDYEFSYDGFMWRPILTGDTTPFAPYNQIGFMAHHPSGSSPNARYPFHWFRVR